METQLLSYKRQYKGIIKPNRTLTPEEKKAILDKSYLSKADFVAIADLPKKVALKLFNDIRKELQEEYGKTGFQIVNTNYLPTYEVVKRIKALKRFT